MKELPAKGKPKRPVPKQLQGKGFEAHPEHINRNGRPKQFDELRKMIVDMGNDEIEIEVGKGKSKKKIKVTRFERILMDWFNSQSFEKQQAIIAHGFGKVPDKLDIGGQLKVIRVRLNKPEDNANNS